MNAELKDQRVPVMMSKADLDAIDTWRRHQNDLPSRGEAIRRLLTFGIDATAKVPYLADALAFDIHEGRKKVRLTTISLKGPSFEFDVLLAEFLKFKDAADKKLANAPATLL